VWKAVPGEASNARRRLPGGAELQAEADARLAELEADGWTRIDDRRRHVNGQWVGCQAGLLRASSLQMKGAEVMEFPDCPLQSCGARFNPGSAHRTYILRAEDTGKAGITAEGPLFRCSYCGGVWSEPMPDEVVPVGVLSLRPYGFEPFETPREVKLTRGRVLSPQV